jgi:hypothetical protein
LIASDDKGRTHVRKSVKSAASNDGAILTPAPRREHFLPPFPFSSCICTATAAGFFPRARAKAIAPAKMFSRILVEWRDNVRLSHAGGKQRLHRR